MGRRQPCLPAGLPRVQEFGARGQAVVQGRDVMKAENSFVRMSVLSLQKSLMTDHCTVHKPFFITTEATANRDKQHVEVPGEP